jgi:hypothetical protein
VQGPNGFQVGRKEAADPAGAGGIGWKSAEITDSDEPVRETQGDDRFGDVGGE